MRLETTGWIIAGSAGMMAVAFLSWAYSLSRRGERVPTRIDRAYAVLGCTQAVAATACFALS